MNRIVVFLIFAIPLAILFFFWRYFHHRVKWIKIMEEKEKLEKISEITSQNKEIDEKIYKENQS